MQLGIGPEHARTAILASSVVPFAAAFMMVAITTALLPHWGRLALASLAVIAAVVGVALGGLITVGAPAGMFDPIVYRYLLPLFALTGSLGGVWAALRGRRLMRGLAQIVVPKRWLGPVAYLWRADGLTPPQADSSQEAANSSSREGGTGR